MVNGAKIDVTLGGHGALIWGDVFTKVHGS
jgi:hypothetical protein